MSDIETVSVSILDKSYQVACPSDEREELETSAKHLDKQMRSIRSSGKVVGLERIAVMAALNITHDMLQKSEAVDQGSQDTGERLRRLADKIDDVINLHRQLEI